MAGPIGSRLDSVARAAEAAGFHGNLLVARQGEVLHLKGYGLANLAAGTRYSPATVVQIGSNTKDFTKVAIYQLVERGLLRLTDSLPRFFPGVPPDQRGITVEHLLDHTAGLPLGVGGGDAQPLTKAEMLRRVFALTLGSAPGATQRYSNLGYSILAAIVEDISGRPFDEYLDENVFRPAGMRETGLLLPRFDLARIAHGYQGGRDMGVILDMPRDEHGHLWSLRGNGGHLSTLGDMRRFYLALRGNTLLHDEEHRRAVLPPDRPSVLAGSDMISFFLFANFPRAAAEVFIASNHAEYRANRLLREIQSVLEIVTEIGGERDVDGGRGGGGFAGRPAVSAPLLDRLGEDGVGRTITAYLEAYNSGDTAVMRRFLLERSVAGPGAPPIEVRLERYRAMRSNLGRLTLRGWRLSPDGAGIAVLAESDEGETVTLTFDVEPEPPYRLRSIRIEVG